MTASLIRSSLPKICLRYDQRLTDIGNNIYQDNKVIIVAPVWVESGLNQLSQYIPKGSKFHIIDGLGKLQNHVIDSELSLKYLVMIARNEPTNTSGNIRFTNYDPLINQKPCIYSLKDLVRQCVIVGMDETTHFGGYPSGQPVSQVSNAIVIDLIGLQFQRNYNTGRLVLIGENLPKGILDDMIYENIVGEKKLQFNEVLKTKSDRYIKHNSSIYFDSHAYKKFVANDVYVSGIAVNQFYKSNQITGSCVNFKFLKYGTGFFAGDYHLLLETYIYDGICDGLEKLFKSEDNKVIKSIEFPFYRKNKAIIEVCNKFSIECKFSIDDALKQSQLICKCHSKPYMTATTNCADPHVVTGNEMGFHSVDSAIAENLKSKGNIFSPIINRLIREEFIVNNV